MKDMIPPKRVAAPGERQEMQKKLRTTSELNIMYVMLQNYSKKKLSIILKILIDTVKLKILVLCAISL